MAITIAKYDPQKIERIKQYLVAQAAKEQARYYEIFVDSFRVLPRTNDPLQFDTYEDHVDAGSQSILIKIFSTSPSSGRNDSHLFKIGEDQPAQSLSGLDVKTQISEAVSQERQRWDHEQVTKELLSVKEDLQQAELYIDRLQEQLADCKARNEKFNWPEFIGNAAGTLNGLSKNAKASPLLESLAGIFPAGESKGEPEHDEPKTEASFSKKTAASPATPDADTLRYLGFLKSMEEQLEEDDLVQVMYIISCLIANPSQIEAVRDLVANPDMPFNP